MPKLHLKRTPAEEEERALRKARKEAKRRARYKLQLDEIEDSDNGGHRSKRHKGYHPDSRFTDDEQSQLHALEEQRLKREEEEQFQQRMWDELGESDRLDNLETDLNSYSHIPHRWRSSAADNHGLKVDPQMMEEEEYAEWVRQGMFRKKHGDLYQEQQRQKASEQARKDRTRELAAETARLEAAAMQERQIKKRERDRNRWRDARDQYEIRWKALLAGEGDENSLLFRDIPWPCLQAYGKNSTSLNTDDLTEDSISVFLLDSFGGADAEKMRRDKLRETLLRFHPDKFEGRVMARVNESDKERVQEAVGIVVRILNEMSKAK